jgi:hypothetical protein
VQVRAVRLQADNVLAKHRTATAQLVPLKLDLWRMKMQQQGQAVQQQVRALRPAGRQRACEAETAFLFGWVSATSWVQLSQRDVSGQVGVTSWV